MDILTAPRVTATVPATAAASLSIVVPAYNEEAVLPSSTGGLLPCSTRRAVCAEIVYVNDGSSDSTIGAAARICTVLTRASSSYLFAQLRQGGRDEARGSITRTVT